MIKTRPQKKTTSQLIKELDDVFSLFVRLRDSDSQGTVTGFITGERIWWRDCDAAHYCSRQHMATRYDEMNVHACSVDSNRYDQDHLEKYGQALNKKYGWDEVLRLVNKSHQLTKFTAFELQEMIDRYKITVAELRRVKKI
jgi:hypothetical protein